MPYFVTEPLNPEEDNRDRLIRDIEAERIDFAFQYWAGLDGLLHMVGNDSPEIPKKLRMYEEWIEQVLAAASRGRRHAR